MNNPFLLKIMRTYCLYYSNKASSPAAPFSITTKPDGLTAFTFFLFVCWEGPRPLRWPGVAIETPKSDVCSLCIQSDESNLKILNKNYTKVS
jgi:hypothetical protein